MEWNGMEWNEMEWNRHGVWRHRVEQPVSCMMLQTPVTCVGTSLRASYEAHSHIVHRVVTVFYPDEITNGTGMEWNRNGMEQEWNGTGMEWNGTATRPLPVQSEGSTRIWSRALPTGTTHARHRGEVQGGIIAITCAQMHRPPCATHSRGCAARRFSPTGLCYHGQARACTRGSMTCSTTPVIGARDTRASFAAVSFLAKDTLDANDHRRTLFRDKPNPAADSQCTLYTKRGKGGVHGLFQTRILNSVRWRNARN